MRRKEEKQNTNVRFNPIKKKKQKLDYDMTSQILPNYNFFFVTFSLNFT